MHSWFARLQNVLPQHALSRAAGALANSRSRWLKALLIEQFARAYGVSLAEAEADSLDDYASFNDFFSRALKAGSRPLNNGHGQLLSPVDGEISQLGEIRLGHLLQAKGQRYTLASLAGPLANGFDNGQFCTIYLAPGDYHRVHLPYPGELIASLAIPGALFSVNGRTENAIEGLFCRNERLVCRFNTEFGPMLVVLVGAMIVASIETHWSGPTSPYQAEELTSHQLHYQAGDEIGRFLLGSTVICCFPADAVSLNSDWHVGSRVLMGEAMGQIRQYGSSARNLVP